MSSNLIASLFEVTKPISNSELLKSNYKHLKQLKGVENIDVCWFGRSFLCFKIEPFISTFVNFGKAISFAEVAILY